MSATSFSGNFTGVASGITGTPNIVVGIMTGTLKGDGSSLTGIAATNWITNNVTGNSANTSVNLSLGNVVKFSQSADTTVSFANTGTSNIVTFIRSRTDFTSGGVDFDGSGDYLSLASSADFNLNTGDWTVEWFAYPTSDTQYQRYFYLLGSTASQIEGIYAEPTGISFGRTGVWASSATTNPLNQWNHYALVHDSTNMRLYVNGVEGATSSNNFVDENKSLNIGYSNGSFGGHFTGKLSNFRIVKGTALYTSDFGPPTSALTNVTNTKLLCCQSTSSTTTAAVTPGTITANGDVSAGSRTITLGQGTLTWPSSITWNGGSAPTLNSDSDSYPNDVNVIKLLTRDEGVTWYGWEDVSFAGGYELYTAGTDAYGALGHNNTTNYSSPTQIPGAWKSLGQKGMTSQMFATKSDNTLWAWGQNTQGELGQNNTVRYSSPVQVPGATWSTCISSNGGHTILTKTDGTLWAMGDNEEGGQLGQNDRTDRSSPVQIPGTTWPTSQENKITAEYGSSWAIKTDGTLWAWGRNSKGELGQNQGSPSDSNNAYSSPAQIPGSTWHQVNSRRRGVHALKTDGTLWGWGWNPYGALGINVGPTGPAWHTGISDRSSPVQIPGTTWKYISGSYFGASGIKTDGTLWMWGRNNTGELGQNNRTDYSSPVQIPGTTWNKVLFNHSAAIATKTDGTLWSWGYNYLGALMVNSQVNYSSPVQIPGTDWVTSENALTRAGSYSFAVLKNP